MGVSKTYLFASRIVAAATPVFEEVIAVQRAGGEPAAIRTIFEEEHQDEAAIFGVARALDDAAKSVAFILAVDYPLVTTDLLQYLRDERKVPVWNGIVQPLCAVWRHEQLAAIGAAIASRRYDLQALIEQEIIPEPVLRARFSGEPLLNVNTPAELEAAERVHGKGFLPPR